MMILNRLFLEDEWDQFSEVMSLIIDDLLNREEQRKPPANVELTEGWASEVNSGLCRTRRLSGVRRAGEITPVQNAQKLLPLILYTSAT